MAHKHQGGVLRQGTLALQQNLRHPHQLLRPVQKGRGQEEGGKPFCPPAAVQHQALVFHAGDEKGGQDGDRLDSMGHHFLQCPRDIRHIPTPLCPHPADGGAGDGLIHGYIRKALPDLPGKKPQSLFPGFRRRGSKANEEDSFLHHFFPFPPASFSNSLLRRSCSRMALSIFWQSSLSSPNWMARINASSASLSWSMQK